MYLFKKTSILKLKFSVILIIILNGSWGFAQNTVGLILNNEQQSYDGYTLFGPKNSTTTYLIDNDGFLINKWETDYKPSATVYLLENGNLLRATKLVDPSGGTGGFQVLDWEGNVVWEYTYGSQNHDIAPLPNGNVLLETNEEIDSLDAVAAGSDPSLLDGNVISLKILEIKNNNGVGEIVWEWSAWEHIVQDFDQSKPNYNIVANHPELIDLNYIPDPNQKWLHHNSIDYNENLDQIMVSIRSYNEFWVIDHSTTTEQAATHIGGVSNKGGDILYRWGNPASYRAGTIDDQKLFGQHDARWIETGLPRSGNITVFNNGLNRPDGSYSSVIEITPPLNNIGGYDLLTGVAYEPNTLTWLYSAPNPTDLYSSNISGAHRLPNGNTLICSGRSGTFIEVTDLGEIVWEYINPASDNGILSQGDEPTKNIVYRSHKYGINYPGLVGQDLTRGDPIELYTDTDGDGIIDNFDNCPNTANPGQEDTDGDGIGDDCDAYPLAVEDSESRINNYMVAQNYPNPFNPITTIEFSISEREFVTIAVFDMLGNKVKTLVSQALEPGIKSVNWDSRDNMGNYVSSGVYFYNIQAGQFTKTKKMILLR